MDENLHGEITEESHNHRVEKYHNVSLTVASKSGAVVLKKKLNVLGRTTVNMSNTAISVV